MTNDLALKLYTQFQRLSEYTKLHIGSDVNNNARDVVFCSTSSLLRNVSDSLEDPQEISFSPLRKPRPLLAMMIEDTNTRRDLAQFSFIQMTGKEKDFYNGMLNALEELTEILSSLMGIFLAKPPESLLVGYDPTHDDESIDAVFEAKMKKWRSLNG